METGQDEKIYDYRKNIVEPWPPNYTLAPIFMVSAILALVGSSAALLQQNFKIAIMGCLCGVLSYGFLIGSVLSIFALAFLLFDREKFETAQ